MRIASLACALWMVAACGAEEHHPNIVLVTVDTLRADHLGSYGYTRATSPNLDALAERGVRFERAWSQAPWTLPSMASLHTSRYPIEHGAVTGQTRLAESAVTLAEVLRGAGYRTVGVVSHLFVGRRFGLAQGFDVFDESNSRGHDAVTSPDVTNTALAALSGIAATERSASYAPFFLWVHYFDPHFSYVRHPEYGFASSYTGSLRAPIEASNLDRFARDLPAKEVAFIEAVYDEEVAFTDAWIGRLVAGVESLSFTGETIFVVTGDHGEYFMERERLGHGKDVYESLIRVPLIVSGAIDPDLRGRVVSGTVEIASVARTIAELAGVEDAPFAGVDLLRVARSGSSSALAFSEGLYAWGRDNPKLAVVSDTGWKLIRNARDQSFELYDLRTDPHERTNRFGDDTPDATAARTRLRDAIHRYLLSGEAPTGPEAQVELTAAEREHLRALGYVR